MSRLQTIYVPMAQKMQALSFSSTAASTTNALPEYCEAVELMATQDCYFEFLTGSATEGTATANSAFIKAGVPYTYACPKGSTDCKVNALRVSADGILYITPLSQ